MYESRCAACTDRREQENEGRKRKRGVDYEEEDVYVGETSRSIYERAKEHVRDGRAGAQDSHIARHWEERHKGEDMPLFRFSIVRGFKDSLSRQVSESVRIDLRKGVLNNKAVYSRNKLPRLEIQKTELEKDDEERRAMLLDWKERQKKEKDQVGENTELSTGEELEIAESWRRLGLSKSREEGRESSKMMEGRPGKRRKVRDRIRETDVLWGQVELSTEEQGVVKWLYEEKPVVQAQEGHKSKQLKLAPWTWLRLEAWNVVVDLARSVESRK